jgi:hypothetical protein
MVLMIIDAGLARNAVANSSDASRAASSALSAR